MKYICVALQVSHLSHNHLGRKPRKKHPFILILGIAQIEEGNLALINFYTFFYFGFPLIFFWIHFVFVPDFCHIFPIFRFQIYKKIFLFVEHPSHRFLVKKFLTHLGTDLKTLLHKVWESAKVHIQLQFVIIYLSSSASSSALLSSSSTTAVPALQQCTKDKYQLIKNDIFREHTSKTSPALVTVCWPPWPSLPPGPHW